MAKQLSFVLGLLVFGAVACATAGTNAVGGDDVRDRRVDAEVNRPGPLANRRIEIRVRRLELRHESRCKGLHCRSMIARRSFIAGSLALLSRPA
mgnify:CR=1 FL=1